MVWGRGTMLLCWRLWMGWIDHSNWTDIWWESVSLRIVKILMFMTQQIMILHPQIHWDLSKAYILRIFNGSVHEKQACSQCSRQGEENLVHCLLAKRTETRLYASTGHRTVGIAEKKRKIQKRFRHGSLSDLTRIQATGKVGQPYVLLSAILKTQRFVNKIPHTRRLSCTKRLFTITWPGPFKKTKNKSPWIKTTSSAPKFEHNLHERAALNISIAWSNQLKIK